MMISESNRDTERCNSFRRRAKSTKINNDTVQKLNIDGFFFDSSAVAARIRDSRKQSNPRIRSREIIFRNISIDETVLQGVRELVESRKISSSRKTDELNHSNTINNTSVDIIHCSGLVSELIRIILPTTRRFVFAGNIPIAHNLDTESLSVIGENLGRTGANSSVRIRTDSGNRGDENDSGVRLKALALKGTRFESSGFDRLCDGLAISTLEDLQLSNCILEADDALLLAAALRRNKTLKSIFFASCKFGTRTRLLLDLQNQRGVETTQSINNTSPQINLPNVLEALVRHPTLESLKIYGMSCNELSIRAIADILRSPESKLRHLGLKNNLSHPQGKLPGVSDHLFRALSQNRCLTCLKVSGNNLNDENMIQLGRILTESNTSIESLLITDNLIANGLLPLASRLSDAKSLRYLDIMRNPITENSKKAMISALKNNVQLERLDLDGSWDEKKFWWLSLNRAGRRVLRASLTKSVPSSLWPTILERAYNLPFKRNSKQPSAVTNMGVVYYLIRRIPGLFEKASLSPSNVLESRPEQKRHRKRAVKAACIELEPKAKRMFIS